MVQDSRTPAVLVHGAVRERLIFLVVVVLVAAVSVVSAYMIIASRQMTGTPMEAVAVVQTAWIVHAVAAGLESVLIIIGRERAIRRMATLTTPKVSFAEPT